MSTYKYYYWKFDAALSHKICDEVIQYGLQKHDLTGKTGNDPRITKKLKKERNSNIVWMDDRWIYKEIQPFIHEANRSAGWNLQWDHSESCQFTKYNKGQFYDWHCDSFPEPYNKPNTLQHGKIRKLSVTCALSDPSEYEGGEIEFDFRDYNPTQRKKYPVKSPHKGALKGSIIVFPSYIWHKVAPVTSGVRYSMVNWVLGQPYK